MYDFFKKKYDYLVVGAGFFGATFARKAADAGKTCLVIDKNDHLAGAAHDKQVHGHLVCQYGAHIFHTKSKEIWDFIQEFSEFNNYINKPKADTGDTIYSFPLNMMTFHQLWGVKTPKEAEAKLKSVRKPVESPRNAEEWILSQVGEEIYRKFIYGYTKKQWLKEPRYLPVSIVKRLPIRLTWEENYFSTDFQGMPIDGFTKIVERMLDDPNIKVELSTDYFSRDWKKVAKHIIYTGPVDKFFDYQYGELEYNTLRFEHVQMTGDYQGTAVMNYTSEQVPYLRSIEHKYFYDLSHLEKHYTPNPERWKTPSIVTFDYPVPFSDHPEPYYPIRDEPNTALYNKYMQLKKDLPHVTFGGRVGEYKYLDIDQTMASAMQKFRSLQNV
jgi:UDP-galactopyranose mutase